MAAIEVKVPDIGDFKDVPVIELLVKPGDVVKKDDSLVTLESDKATMEVPAPQAGTVKELRVKLGDKVSEGATILTLEAGAAPAPPAWLTTPAMSSPGSAMTPMRAPTGTFPPACTRIFRRTPLPKASISTSALSVSTSARMSPLWTRSPSFLSHLMILPLSIASESFGIWTFVTAMVSPRSRSRHVGWRR